MYFLEAHGKIAKILLSIAASCLMFVSGFGQAQVNSSISTPADYGAIGDGIVDDTAAFEAAVTQQGYLFLTSNKTYRITRLIRLPRAIIIASDGTARLKLEGAGGLVIQAPGSSFYGFRIDGAGMSLSSCVFSIANGISGWFRDTSISDVNANNAPCMVRDLSLPVSFGGNGSIVGLYLDRITSTNGRGPQISLKSAFAFLFMRDLNLQSAVALSNPMIYIERNQGAMISNVTISGLRSSIGGFTGAGLEINNFAAIWLSKFSVNGMGGSGIKTGQLYGNLGPNQGLYLSDIVATNNGGCGIDAKGILMLTSRNLQVFNNTVCQTVFDGSIAKTETVTTSPAWWVEQANTSLMLPKSKAPIPNLYVSVGTFGAKGDGVADDSAAFEAAINSGKSIYVPAAPRFYKLSRTIVINRPLAIVGLEDQSKIVSSATRAFDIRSSNVSIEGLHIEMNSATPMFTIAIYLDASAAALTDVHLSRIRTTRAGYSITNIGAFANQIKRLYVSKVYIDDLRYISVNLSNIADSRLDRIFGNIPTVPMQAPFIWLERAANVSVSDSTMLGKAGNPAPTSPYATTIVVKSSSDVFINRWQSDTTNSYGTWIEGSTRVFASDTVYSTDLPAVVVKNSTLIYFVNSLLAYRNTVKSSDVTVDGSNTVYMTGLINLYHLLGFQVNASPNVLVQNFQQDVY
jgi:hypothetical protein